MSKCPLSDQVPEYSPSALRVSLRIQSECGKIRTRNKCVLGHFSRSVIVATMFKAVKRRKNWRRIIYLRGKNMNRLLIDNLSINSISNNFDQLKFLVQGKVDIHVITETKLNSTFPTSQILIEGYNEPYRFDRNRNGVDVLIYVREDIPSKTLTDHKLSHDIEGIFVELNLRKNKWLLFGSYHPPSQSDEYFFNHVKNGLDICSKFYVYWRF